VAAFAAGPAFQGRFQLPDRPFFRPRVWESCGRTAITAPMSSDGADRPSSFLTSKSISPFVSKEFSTPIRNSIKFRSHRAISPDARRRHPGLPARARGADLTRSRLFYASAHWAARRATIPDERSRGQPTQSFRSNLLSCRHGHCDMFPIARRPRLWLGRRARFSCSAQLI
jgi:hypothetical protein